MTKKTRPRGALPSLITARTDAPDEFGRAPGSPQSPTPTSCTSRILTGGATVHDFPRQLPRGPIRVPQRKHSGFDLFLVEEPSLATRKTGQGQGQRQEIKEFAIPTLDFARVTAHGS
jgi:hypothetical protein